MIGTEQVILAFEAERNAAHIRDILEGGGIAECLLCRTAAEVKRVIGQTGISSVVCGYKLSDETAESLFDDLPPYCSMLVIAVQGLLDLIESSRIQKLSAPAARSELISAVRGLLQSAHGSDRFAGPRRTEQERTLIRQAKLYLMALRGMDEESAHKYLQKKSMDTGERLALVAQKLLDGQGCD